MATIHEQVSEQFHRWEKRLRGDRLWPEPVWPEPPFVPFEGYVFPTEYVDDGRKPTFLSSAFHAIWPRQPEPIPEMLPFEPEPEPEPLVRETVIELALSFPRDGAIRKTLPESFLRTLAYCAEPIGFEVIGMERSIELQFVVAFRDLQHVRNQIRTHFSYCELRERQGFLEGLWKEALPNQMVVQFSLERESMLPLRCGTDEPLQGLVASLSSLQEAETAVLQVLFKPTRSPWRESMLRSVTDLFKHPVFINAPELAKGAEEKVEKPLFATTFRLALKAPTADRLHAMVRGVGSALSVYNSPGANALVPLSDEDYQLSDHVHDLTKRQTRRCGMLLNSDELAAFVHLPNSGFYAPKLFSNSLTHRAPEIVLNTSGVLLGINEHAGEAREVRLSADQRVRNTYVIGTPGTGKSTLLLQLIRQDLERGDGIAVIDPHGDLIESVLGTIPEGRINDCVYLDPSDERFSIGFNVLSAHSEIEKNLLAADLVSVFERLSTSWGDQMGIVLKKAILAFLESPRGGTLVDLQRFLIEPAFRKDFLETVTDSDVTYYWNKAFPLLSGSRSIGPILTRLETFLSSKSLRHMVSQRENRLDFSSLMNGRKIFLAKLSQGLIGKENSYLLGSLLMSKFQQAAMGRQQLSEEKRPYFWIFADEFHDFITPSMAEILSGARKYRVGMVLAHQEVRQLDRVPEVASAVRSAFTRVCFRVTDQDGKALAGGFSSFSAQDLQQLSLGEAICRVERSDFDFNLKILPPAALDLQNAAERRRQVLEASQATFGFPRRKAEEKPGRQDDSQPPEQGSQKPAVSSISAKIESESEKDFSSRPEATGKPAAKILELVPGRGGVQHKAIQKRIKVAAERLGYRATIEREILNGEGSIDLALESEKRSIAVEITVTTTIDHEVGNVLKCLKAGFSKVAVISSSEAKLRQLGEAVIAALGSSEAYRVEYFLPDGFISHLGRIAQSESGSGNQPSTQVRGYKVKRTVSKIDPESAKAREEEAIKTLAKAMKGKISTNTSFKEGDNDDKNKT